MSEERKMGHVQPFKNYLFTFIALLILTIVTVLASKVQFKFDLWNNLIAVGIAGIKASLVTLFFMHGRYEGRLTWAFVYYPVILLLLLLGGVFLDYGFRGDENRVIQEVTIAQEKGHDDAAHGHGAEGDHATEPAERHGSEPADEHGTAPATGQGEDHAAPQQQPPEEKSGDEQGGHN